jgi:hypothetical protein
MPSFPILNYQFQVWATAEAALLSPPDFGLDISLSKWTETGADFVMVLKTGEYSCAIRTISSFCSPETSASILK